MKIFRSFLFIGGLFWFSFAYANTLTFPSECGDRKFTYDPKLTTENQEIRRSTEGRTQINDINLISLHPRGRIWVTSCVVCQKDDRPDHYFKIRGLATTPGVVRTTPGEPAGDRSCVDRMIEGTMVPAGVVITLD